jgi:DNA-binding IclR family transcriptional regulator
MIETVDSPAEEVAAPSSAGQGIERVTTILKALAVRARTGARLTDIAVATGLSKSTVHRFIGTLMAEGLVETDSKTGLLYLGFEVCVLGAAAANRFGLVDLSRDALTELERLTQDTIYLSVRADNDAICIDRLVGSYPIKVLTLDIGDRRPLGVGAGSLALLAGLTDEEIEPILAANAHRLADYPAFAPDSLRKMVSQTREKGYAFNDGRIIPGMCALAVPIIDRAGRPLAALAVAATTDRMQGRRRATLATWMTEAAETLAQRLALVQGVRSSPS